MGSSFSTSIQQEIEGSEHWLSPADLIAHLDIRSGMTVAEIGAGTGFYTLPIARRVGSAGSVFSVEWRPGLINELRTRLAGADGLQNVRFVAGSPADTHLPTAFFDLALFADVWHGLDDRDAVLDEAKRILRADGRMAILNWRPDGLRPRVPRFSSVCL